MEKIISRVLGTITKLTIKNKTGIIMGLKLKREPSRRMHRNMAALARYGPIKIPRQLSEWRSQKEN